MADDRPLWGYPEVAAHMGISVQAARSRKSRGSLPAPDDATVPHRPQWKPATFEGWNQVGRGFRADPHRELTPASSPAGLGSDAS
ncbi:hypothetical protein GCM10018791_49550 [Streptomyces zaomyceticus]|nr:hypothetical protein GCM10018791_49550 [Streptomyces zaomyceticus]